LVCPWKGLLTITGVETLKPEVSAAAGPKSSQFDRKRN